MAAAKKSKKKISVQSMIVQPYGVELIVSNDWDKLTAYLEENFEWKCDLDVKGLMGISFTMECAPTGEVKFVQFAVDDQTLVHECVHSAFHILDHVGIRLSGDNHEALAYTVDWIFGECKEWLK